MEGGSQGLPFKLRMWPVSGWTWSLMGARNRAVSSVVYSANLEEDCL